jgi:outer membrane protein assembly factor BamA
MITQMPELETIIIEHARSPVTTCFTEVADALRGNHTVKHIRVEGVLEIERGLEDLNMLVDQTTSLEDVTVANVFIDRQFSMSRVFAAIDKLSVSVASHPSLKQLEFDTVQYCNSTPSTPLSVVYTEDQITQVNHCKLLPSCLSQQ